MSEKSTKAFWEWHNEQDSKIALTAFDGWNAALDWSRPLVAAAIEKAKKAKREKKVKSDSSLAFTLSPWIPQEVWAGFEEMRKKIRKPLTDRARRLTINTLIRLKNEGEDPVACLDQSTQRAWQGVFAVKEPQQSERRVEPMHHHAPGDMSDGERELYRRFEESAKRRIITDHKGNFVASL